MLVGSIRYGRTLDTPVTMDFGNSVVGPQRQGAQEMSPDPGFATKHRLIEPCPGHADLAGMRSTVSTVDDARNVPKRASAREAAPGRRWNSGHDLARQSASTTGARKVQRPELEERTSGHQLPSGRPAQRPVVSTFLARRQSDAASVSFPASMAIWAKPDMAAPDHGSSRSACSKATRAWSSEPQTASKLARRSQVLGSYGSR